MSISLTGVALKEGCLHDLHMLSARTGPLPSVHGMCYPDPTLESDLDTSVAVDFLSIEDKKFTVRRAVQEDAAFSKSS